MILAFCNSILILVLLSVIGCAGSSSKVMSTQVAQIEAQSKQKDLQGQLMTKVAALPPRDYKDYKVGPEDSLEIFFLGQDELHRILRINGQGELDMPLVGTVSVAGLTTQEISQKLRQKYKQGEFLNNPQITVVVQEYRHQKVAVTGAVNKPDYYSIIGPRTLLEMLAMAGGLNERSGEVINIIRPKGAESGTPPKSGQVLPYTPGYETIPVDLDRLVRQGDISLNHTVKNGDVINVPFVRTAYVLGSVVKPGSVDLKQNLTVAQAVALSGGLHPMLSSSNITVLRTDNQGQRIAFPIKLNEVTSGKGVDPPLKENDIVFVHESPLRRFLIDLKTLIPGNVSVSPAALM